MTIIEYRDSSAIKARGPWYTFSYENGRRASLSDYQGDVHDLEDIGRKLSKESGREVRMKVHTPRGEFIHAIFIYGRPTRR